MKIAFTIMRNAEHIDRFIPQIVNLGTQNDEIVLIHNRGNPKKFTADPRVSFIKTKYGDEKKDIFQGKIDFEIDCDVVFTLSGLWCQSLAIKIKERRKRGKLYAKRKKKKIKENKET